MLAQAPGCCSGYPGKPAEVTQWPEASCLGRAKPKRTAQGEYREETDRSRCRNRPFPPAALRDGHGFFRRPEVECRKIEIAPEACGMCVRCTVEPPAPVLPCGP